MAQAGSNDEKNSGSKISLDCLFKKTIVALYAVEIFKSFTTYYNLYAAFITNLYFEIIWRNKDEKDFISDKRKREEYLSPSFLT